MPDAALIPAVLVHGLIGALDDRDLVGQLGLRRVLSPDLLGYGQRASVPPERIQMDAQADQLAREIEAMDAERVHLVGHSVGSVVAALFADRHPERVASFTSVEGNFTLRDAFWSARVARMTTGEADEMIGEYRADPAGWLRGSGVDPDERTLGLARRWLAYQPPSTVRAMARAVVDTTGRSTWEPLLRGVFDRTIVHLVAGDRSRDGWDVPAWAVQAAGRVTVIPSTGHLMMAERPQVFAQTISMLIAGDRGGDMARTPHAS